MEPTRSHPSFLEIDRASLGRPSPELQAHLSACSRCAAHYQRVSEREPLPAWMSERTRRFSLARALRRWRAGLLAGAALATASLALVVLRPWEEPQVPMVTEKGTPSLALFVKRGEKVALWDGHSSLVPGDQLRLRVSPEGFRHVLVLTAPGPEAPVVLYSGALPGTGATLLPSAWSVDATPGPEEIAVVLSQGELSRERTDAALHSGERNSEVWTTRLSFPKDPPPEENGR